MTALDAETGQPLPPRLPEVPRLTGTVFVRLAGAGALIEVGSADLATKQAGSTDSHAYAALVDVAELLREVADQLTRTSAPVVPIRPVGRHLVPYGLPSTLCGVDVDDAAWNLAARDYTDDRFTTHKARTTCPECLTRIDPTENESTR